MHPLHQSCKSAGCPYGGHRAVASSGALFDIARKWHGARLWAVGGALGLSVYWGDAERDPVDVQARPRGARGGLAIYPSGDLEPYHPGLLPFKTGAFRLAAMTKAPLVPVVLKQQTRLCINRLLGRPAFEVHIGEPVAVPHGRLSKEAVEVLEQQVRTAMESALSGQDAPQIGGAQAQDARKYQVDEA